MKTINLTQGKVAMVDDEDFDKINKFKWFAHRNGNRFYALRNSKPINGKRGIVYMHRVIIKTPKNMMTDHIDGDGLNNQKNNLRICTPSENGKNQSKHSNNASGYKGVHWHKYSKKWTSYIRVDGKAISLGYFTSKELAYQAYVAGAKKYHKDFANY